MKRLIFLLLMMAHSVSWAGWDFTGETDELFKYHDKSSIQINGSTAQMWTMYDFREIQTDADGDKFKSVKSLLLFNCKYETLAMISILQYSGSLGTGDLVLSDTFKENELIWDRIVPNTLVKTEWEIACGKK